MLKLADLATRPDLRVGSLTISPARRFVQGPAGEMHLEPRIMQVLLLLLDSAGRVVTRDELFEKCWGGAMVGNDNINHAIAAIRRIAVDVAPGAFEIETIPRTGYRMTGEHLNDGAISAVEDEEKSSRVSRRVLLGSGFAAAAVGGTAIWRATRLQTDARFEALMQRGKEALRLDQPDASKYFAQAASLQPDNAQASGLLAYSLASGTLLTAPVTDRVARETDRAARTALAIDAREPDALLALALIEAPLVDFYAREESLRHILAIAPQHANTMRYLGSCLHGVGRCRDSLAVVERALNIEPLAPDHWARKAGRLWVLGRLGDADRVIDRAMQVWPSHRIVRLMRLMIYAFTGRTQAALPIVEEEESNPVFLPRPVASIWRTWLVALETRSAPAVPAAREASIEGSQGSPQIASQAILVLSALGEIDAAFEVANGFLLDRGSVIVRKRPDTPVSRGGGTGWRNTFGLFIPPTKAMRLDPRFNSLAEGLGLADYWRERGIGPDEFLFKP